MADNILVLPDTTIEFNDFKQQFESFYANGTTWQGQLTTMTSTTLIDMVSTVGTFLAGRVIRASEDAFAETAQSDDAIRANAQAQGIRMTRYLPAQVPATLQTPFSVSIRPLTQFTAGGQYFFNRTQLDLQPGDNPVTLYQGRVETYAIAVNTLTGGSDLQNFVSPDGNFTVSDQDVEVQINQVVIPKALGGLWNYRGLPAYSDLTTADGRLLLQFGSTVFGTVPQVNDLISIRYAVTMGDAGNNLLVTGKPVNIDGFPAITGTLTDSTSGGANDKPVGLYKNVASGSLGTYSSAVTKPQYVSIIATYPGVVDAYTQAQREINPRALEWMNIIRVSALTTSTWSQQQKQDFCDYCQTVTMYAPYFVYQDAIKLVNDVDVEIYVFNSADTAKVRANSEAAIQELFAPRPGLLMTNLYPYDIEQVIKKANPGLISYVIVNTPSGPMIVTAPPSPPITYTLIPGGGSLGERVYAYSISTIIERPDPSDPTSGNMVQEEGPPSRWVFPQIISPVASYAINLTWPAVPNAVSYKVWGRVGANAGLMATLPASTRTFTDNGSITPGGDPPNTLAEVPIRYNSLRNLTLTVKFAERQQRVVEQDPTRRISE